MLGHVLLTIGTLSCFSQAFTYNTRFPGTTWDDDTWTIATTHLDQGHYQSRMSLSNGYLGINVAALGPFFEVDVPVDGDLIAGWPLFDRRQTFATIAGFYDSQPTTNGTNFEWLYQYGGESCISGVPHWAGLHVSVGDEVLMADTPASQISNFRSTLGIKNASMIWSYTWTPSSGSPIDIEYSMFVHKLHVNQAYVQLQMTSHADQNVTVVDLLDGDCALRTTFAGQGYSEESPMIWTSVSPMGLDNITAYIYSTMETDAYAIVGTRRQDMDKAVIGYNSSSIAQAVDVALQAGTTATVTKYIGGASSDAFDTPQTIALQATINGTYNGIARTFASHVTEWRSIMPDDSVDSFREFATSRLPDDPNVVELAITAVTNPFHMVQNTVGKNAIAESGSTKLDGNSIAVGGLGSDAYAGWIFWDAEVWMAPGLVVSFPQAAKQIAQYRVDKFPQAKANIETAYQSSQNMTEFSPQSAVFPWVSGRFGNCTAAGPCFDYEYHINGDIGLEVYNYYAVTGDEEYFSKELLPIYDAAAQFYVDLVDYNMTSREYDLYNATDPDEYANFKDNVGYTMVLMQTHIDMADKLRARLGMQQNETWSDISSLINVPVDDDAGIILEYTTMNGSIQVKQADVVLVDDFLDYPNPYSSADFDYYAGRQSPDGPGMTYGVFSIIASRIDPSGCAAYTYDLYGAQPYIRGPWFQFSEQLIDNFQENGGTHPAYPFLTGIGGANRVAIFGYLGLRLMLDSLNVDPVLPPQIPYIRYRTIYWQGWPISAASNQTHTTIGRLFGGKPLDNANMTFATSPIPLTIGLEMKHIFPDNSTVYNLAPNQNITIPNRQPGLLKTVPGNIAQCHPVSSQNPYEPGQFPLSAVDGSISTKWQPTNPNTTSTLTLALSGPFVPITSLHFDWAQAPPQAFTVTFSNTSQAFPNTSSTSFNSSTIASTAAVHVYTDNNVAVSNPYVPAEAAVITPYMSNTTNVTLETPVWSGKFATLTIRGTRAGAGRGMKGASVAEWAIVARDGRAVEVEAAR